MSDAAERLLAALDVAMNHAAVDGSHHLRWVIDQMVRALLTQDEYTHWCADDPEWDKGIAP